MSDTPKTLRDAGPLWIRCSNYTTSAELDRISEKLKTLQADPDWWVLVTRGDVDVFPLNHSELMRLVLDLTTDVKALRATLEGMQSK